MTADERSKQQALEQLEPLRGSASQFAEYTAPSADWDHDHCEGCWEKLATFEAPDVLHEGYFTASQPRNNPTEGTEFIKQARDSGRTVTANPDGKKWICPECFEMFQNALE